MYSKYYICIFSLIERDIGIFLLLKETNYNRVLHIKRLIM